MALDSDHPARWWHLTEDGRAQCDLCPWHCVIREGERGFCFVRQNLGGQLVSTTYGRSTGFCIDPIEKKPLNHFYPGTPVLSFGTAGCNLACKYCQNWTITRSRDVEAESVEAAPEAVALAARNHGCRSVAFTYNDPIVWAEYAIDCAEACHALGIQTVAVTSGYINPAARSDLFRRIDAANVDLKAFTEEFYRTLTGGHLQPVLDTLQWIVHESNTWLEITTLLIPRANDSPEELKRLCEWVATELGPDVPLHFSAFHPDYKLMDRGPTPPSTLRLAADIARQAGLRYVYTGNIHDPENQHTLCPRCHEPVIEREGYEITAQRIRDGCCMHCGEAIAGRFDNAPGTWGNRRLPVDIPAVVPTGIAGDNGGDLS